jgi:hypothetical protein
MAFHRDAVDLDEFVADLRRTVSDDALLTDRVAGVDSDPSLISPMYVSGTVSETLSRQVRWTTTAQYLDPGGLAVGAMLPVGVLVGTLFAPLVTVPLVTAVAALAYAYCGIARWTFLFTVPAYVLSIPLVVYGVLADEFVWTGRRYRWTSLYDVEVVDHEAR